MAPHGLCILVTNVYLCCCVGSVPFPRGVIVRYMSVIVALSGHSSIFDWYLFTDLRLKCTCFHTDSPKQ